MTSRRGQVPAGRQPAPGARAQHGVARPFALPRRPEHCRALRSAGPRHRRNGLPHATRVNIRQRPPLLTPSPCCSPGAIAAARGPTGSRQRPVLAPGLWNAHDGRTRRPRTGPGRRHSRLQPVMTTPAYRVPSQTRLHGPPSLVRRLGTWNAPQTPAWTASMPTPADPRCQTGPQSGQAWHTLPEARSAARKGDAGRRKHQGQKGLRTYERTPSASDARATSEHRVLALQPRMQPLSNPAAPWWRVESRARGQQRRTRGNGRGERASTPVLPADPRRRAPHPQATVRLPGRSIVLHHAPEVLAPGAPRPVGPFRGRRDASARGTAGCSLGTGAGSRWPPPVLTWTLTSWWTCRGRALRRRAVCGCGGEGESMVRAGLAVELYLGFPVGTYACGTGPPGRHGRSRRGACTAARVGAGAGGGRPSQSESAAGCRRYPAPSEPGSTDD